MREQNIRWRAFFKEAWRVEATFKNQWSSLWDGTNVHTKHTRLGQHRAYVKTVIAMPELLVPTGPHQQKHRSMLFQHTHTHTGTNPSPPKLPPHSGRGGTDFCHAVSPSCFDRRSRNLRRGGAFKRIMPRWAPGHCSTSSSYAVTPSSHNALILSRWRQGPGWKSHHVSPVLHTPTRPSAPK